MKKFKVNAYTGARIADPFWGAFVIDVSGIRTPPGKMPVLREHIRTRPVGVLVKTLKKKNQFSGNGYFLSSADGKECEALLREGFPFECSVGIRFEQVEVLEKDEIAPVNGSSFKGPGTIVRQSFVREVSFVSLGADSHTSISNLTENRREFMSIPEKTDQPEGFDEALKIFLDKGHGIDEAIKMAVERFPRLYNEYCASILNPYNEQLV